MKKEWGLIPKILSGEKTIESRWYKNRSRPWNKIHKGDIVYFKDTGSPVTAVTTVSKVKQFENLNPKTIQDILTKYSHKDFGTTDIQEEIMEYVKNKKYCILIHLTNPRKIKPFDIDKSGFGLISAWITVKNTNEIQIRHR